MKQIKNVNLKNYLDDIKFFLYRMIYFNFSCSVKSIKITLILLQLFSHLILVS